MEREVGQMLISDIAMKIDKFARVEIRQHKTNTTLIYSHFIDLSTRYLDMEIKQIDIDRVFSCLILYV